MYNIFQRIAFEKKYSKPLQKRNAGIIKTDAFLYIIFMYRSLMFFYCHICQCMHDLVYETIKYEEQKHVTWFYFCLSHQLMKHTWHYLNKSYWIHIDETDLWLWYLKLEGSLSVSEDSNVRTVSVGLASTWPSVGKKRKNQQIKSHI